MCSSDLKVLKKAAEINISWPLDFDMTDSALEELMFPKDKSDVYKRQQILGKMRPPSKGWYTYDEQIRAELDNLRKALNEARSRGISEAVNNKYPNINKVSELQPPKSTDAKVPKICQ